MKLKGDGWHSRTPLDCWELSHLDNKRVFYFGYRLRLDTRPTLSESKQKKKGRLYGKTTYF